MPRDQEGRRYWYVVMWRVSTNQKWTVHGIAQTKEETKTHYEYLLNSKMDEHAWVDVRVERQYK